MEPRYPHFVLAEKSDEVRYWAELEGKSDTMRDDLYREHVPHSVSKNPTLPRVFAVSELIVAVIETLRHIRSR